MSPARSRTGRRSRPEDELSAFAGHLSPDADLTWLLNLAAQRMRAVMEELAERHGLTLRDYIVLSALRLEENLTQLELGRALGLDKTTLMFQLDRLQKKGLVVRRADPGDRRTRIPQTTSAGRAVQERVAAAATEAERQLLSDIPVGEQKSLRQVLCRVIGTSERRAPTTGSCL